MLSDISSWGSEYKDLTLQHRRALSNVADEGLLTEGFFWIPSLAGPTSIAAQKTVSPYTCLHG